MYRHFSFWFDRPDTSSASSSSPRHWLRSVVGLTVRTCQWPPSVTYVGKQPLPSRAPTTTMAYPAINKTTFELCFPHQILQYFTALTSNYHTFLWLMSSNSSFDDFCFKKNVDIWSNARIQFDETTETNVEITFENILSFFVWRHVALVSFVFFVSTCKHARPHVVALNSCAYGAMKSRAGAHLDACAKGSPRNWFEILCLILGILKFLWMIPYRFQDG